MADWVAFEGPDRCGKSTQMKLAETWLKTKGVPVVIARDPDPDVAADIRHVMLSNSHFEESTYLLLYMAARSEMYHKKIVPHLNGQGVILCDRYRLSTMVYQSRFGPDLQDRLHAMAGMEQDPSHYLVFLPEKRFTAPTENWRDAVSDDVYWGIVRGYEAAAGGLTVPASICRVNDESPEEVFERFTKPCLSRVIEKL